MPFSVRNVAGTRPIMGGGIEIWMQAGRPSASVLATAVGLGRFIWTRIMAGHIASDVLRDVLRQIGPKINAQAS